jgi:hypothetical protein
MTPFQLNNPRPMQIARRFDRYHRIRSATLSQKIL